MPILITLFIVMIGAQILASLYASINPFVEQLGNIQRYNIAYYGAIGGIERSYLVLRGHEAGFTGSGGFIDHNSYGSNSDGFKYIKSKEYFGQLSLDGMGNGFFWSIDGLTDSDGKIPVDGNGDLDPDISSGNDYRILTFDQSLQYAFYKDITGTDSYYTGVSDSNIENIKIDNNLQLSIRVPMKLYDKYGGGGTMLGKDSIDLDNDGINNDIIVNRLFFGYTGSTQFAVFPTIDIDYTTKKPNTKDTTIRESNINYYNTDINNEIFYTNGSDTNPNVGGGNIEDITDFNQSPVGSVGTGFDILLKNSQGGAIKKMHLKLSLINYLKYTQDKVYPYLEVKLNAGKKIPKLDFDIVGRGKAHEYDVRINIKKPVFKTNSASDFTVLF